MIFVHRLQRDKYAEPMNGIPKGLCSFGQVKGDSPRGGEMS
ncbi:hypothetical protein [Ruminococcus flavefaciens]|nr:hypothetical protein [Ruminococcus flavefaciens]